MIKRIIHIALFFSFTICFGFVNAQNTLVEFQFEKDSIIIGDQLFANFILNTDKAEEVIFPSFTDTLISGIEILNIGDIEIEKKDEGNITYKRTIILTSFEAGAYTIPPQTISWVVGNDTLSLETNMSVLTVNQFIDIDTIPRDTVWANYTGSIVFGKNNFMNEIEQSIPDSVRQGLSEDELKPLYDSVFQIHAQRFASLVFNNTGLKDNEGISLIIGSPLKQLFIADKNGIKEHMRVPGATDTIFVNEFDTVQKKEPLFVVYIIKDIDDTLFNTPLTIRELWQRLMIFLKNNWWWILITLSAIVAGLYFLLRKKGINPLKIRIKPEEPPHIIALRELERIRIEKIWHHGKVKEYYTQVTDVLRQYIERQYGIYAMEMTSDELLIELKSIEEINTHDYNHIMQVLQLSDFVKFAKFEPQNHEHSNIHKLSKEFIENTLIEVKPDTSKPIIAEIEEAGINKENDENKE